MTTSISSGIKQCIADLDPETKDYLKSAQQEIYEIRLSSHYAGMSYSNACIFIRRNYKATLIAIGNKRNGNFEIIINAHGSVLVGHEHAFVLVEGLHFD
jgi:hypothetical protein